jgi:hypothetical protein
MIELPEAGVWAGQIDPVLPGKRIRHVPRRSKKRPLWAAGFTSAQGARRFSLCLVILNFHLNWGIVYG